MASRQNYKKLKFFLPTPQKTEKEGALLNALKKITTTVTQNQRPASRENKILESFSLRIWCQKSLTKLQVKCSNI